MSGIEYGYGQSTGILEAIAYGIFSWDDFVSEVGEEHLSEYLDTVSIENLPSRLKNSSYDLYHLVE